MASFTWSPNSNSGGGSGTDSQAIHKNSSSEISSISEKVTPHDNDLLLIEDSESSNGKKKLKISSLPSGGAHTHTESEITDLGNYSSVGHSHSESDISDLGNYSSVGHTHTESEISDLQSYSLNSHNHSGVYAPASHTHTKVDISDLPVFSEGTYNPNFTNISNMNSASGDLRYSRVGNSVTVWGTITWDASSAGSGQFNQVRASLPIAPTTNFTDTSSDLSGTMNGNDGSSGGDIIGTCTAYNSASTNEVKISATNYIGTAAETVSLIFSYRIA